MAEGQRRNEVWVLEQLSRDERKDLLLCCQSGFMGHGECDIVALDRRRALLVVLEVKEWGADALEGTEKNERYWQVHGIGNKRSPLRQAQDALISLLDRLPRDLKPDSARYSYLAGTIFTNVSRVEAQRLGMIGDKNILPDGHPYLWLDDVESQEPAGRLLKALDEATVARRWHRRAEISGRIADRIWKRVSPKPSTTKEPKSIRIPTTRAYLDDLDSELQSVFEKSKRGHHRVNGVVGSGKTLFIAHKALSLAESAIQQPELFGDGAKPVLTMCFTRSAASKLRNDIDIVARRGYPKLASHWPKHIEVVHFHRFVSKHYGIMDADEFLRSNPGPAPGLRYSNIMFDEYQDFQSGWGRFITAHLANPETGLLMLTFDPAQGSRVADLARAFDDVLEQLRHGGQKELGWRGRNWYFRTSHRVPQLIGRLAMAVHTQLTKQEFEHLEGSAEDLAKVIHRASEPHFSTRGGTVLFRECDADDSEREFEEIYYCIEQILDEYDVSLGDIAVAIPPTHAGAKAEELGASLRELGIKTFILEGNRRDQFHVRGERILIGTPVRIKGLEIPVVIVPPSLFRYLDSPRAAKQAFYQTLTRATAIVALIGTGMPWDLAKHEAGRLEDLLESGAAQD